MCVCETRTAGAGPDGQSSGRGFRDEKHDGKTSKDLIKSGVKGHEQGKRYLIAMLPLDDLALMFNAALSHKHRAIGTTLGQIMSAALGL